MESQPFYEIVAQRLIAQLAAGTAPWQKPWKPDDSSGMLPINPATGKRYRGINAIQLMSHGYDDPRWMTYQQAAAAGAQVRTGQSGIAIQYWKFSEEQDQFDAAGQRVLDARGDPVKQRVPLERPRMFFATVFNAEQIDGLPPLSLHPSPDWVPVERAEKILTLSGAVIEHGPRNGAFYRLETDSIHLPDKAQFSSPDNYYAVALHELSHWTGHASRLDREQSFPYGSEDYAREELRAEIASMMLGDTLGLGHDPQQHAAYVGHWITVLQDDPLEIFRAAADAEKIHNYVLGLERIQQQAQDAAREPGVPTTAAPPRARPMPPELAAVTFIRVPFAHKKQAKALGAQWSRQAQSWFVPAGVDTAPFAQWLKPGATASAPAPTPAREYLAVPYGERNAAKAAGACWDPVAKSWYAGLQADRQKIARWQLENVRPQQGPAMRPQEEFADALRAMGCVVSGEHPLMDGQKHAIRVEGEGADGAGGFYIGHLKERASGYIRNEKTGVDMQWKSKGYALQPQEKDHLLAQAGRHVQARASAQAQAQAHAQAQAAERVRQEMAQMRPVTQPTAYMRAKGITPQAGVLTDHAGRGTYVPVVDAEGRLWSMQHIQDDGSKRFAKDSRKEGCFHAVGGMQALARAPAVVIAEAYATAGSLSQSLGFATVAALDAGNLPAVAKALRAKFPDKPIIIAGDDDRHLEMTQGINPGKVKAHEAAKATGATVLLPIFAAGENHYPAELPPITPQKYREHLRTGKALNAQQLQALAKMQSLTDFNDLAHKSLLGTQGLDRQVRSAVHAAIDKHQVRTVQQAAQQAQQAQQPAAPAQRAARRLG